ncbi:hypothetical protein [Paracraurococcus lichenis]|uniref:Uncharacterized protein n=1 Tax=Paracraurococcus lichenis TaxID=3064888 RepID=A0ABT9E8H7_9PROT|nr:hypothetical protein [Paracraurococcus sp. LOR1-02]MDO9712456.1 hypothetical protein [Paracraurococcus sp. LOR1-02]
MVELARFEQNYTAITEGAWIRVGEEYGDLEIQTRGFTDQYTDAQTRRQRQAAKAYEGDVSRLPVALRRKINIDCLCDFVLMGVRNLTVQGTPVDFPTFCNLLKDPRYAPLVEASFRAVNRVGQQLEADIEDAVGNSVPA